MTLIYLATLSSLTKADESSVYAVYPTVLDKNGKQLKLSQFDWDGNVSYSVTSSVTSSSIVTVLEPKPKVNHMKITQEHSNHGTIIELHKTTVRERRLKDGEENEISYSTNRESTDSSTEKAQGKGDTNKKFESLKEKVQTSKHTGTATKSNENVELEIQRTDLEQHNLSDKQKHEHVNIKERKPEIVTRSSLNPKRQQNNLRLLLAPKKRHRMGPMTSPPLLQYERNAGENTGRIKIEFQCPNMNGTRGWKAFKDKESCR